MKTKLLPFLVSMMFLLMSLNMGFAQTNPCGVTGQPVGCCPCSGCAPITQLPSLCVSQVGPVTIPVTISTSNFADIAAISLKLDFDPTVIQFVAGGITAPNLPAGYPLPMAGQPNGPASITISWAYPGGPMGSGWYLASGQVLFNLQFNVVNAGVSTLAWNLNECSYSSVAQVLSLTSNILCQTANNYVNGRVSLLTASVLQPVETCVMSTVQLSGSYSATSAPYTCKWTGAGAAYLNSTTVNNPYFTCPTPGTYMLTYTVWDGFGCSATTNAQVLVKASPSCSISGPLQICGLTTNTYTSTVLPEGGTVTHLWSITGDGTISGPDDQPTVTVIAGASGAYTLTDATNRNGCPGWCHVDVTVNANPTGVITGNTPICGGSTNTYTCTVTPAGGTVTHAWSISGSGTINGSVTGASVNVTGGVSGMFTLVDNFIRNGCPGTASKTITVNPVPSCSIIGPSPVCIGEPTVYSSTVTPLEGTVTHAWTISGHGTINGPTNTASVTVTGTSSGTFTLTDAVTRNGCCTSCTKVVTVKPTPTACILGPSPVCGGSIYSYETDVQPSGGLVTHYWTITGNGQLLGSGNEVVWFWTEPTARVLAGASGSFTLTDNITRDGCPGVVTRTVVVNPIPTCNISGSPSVCAGATGLVYTCTTVPTGASHHWTITGCGTINGSCTGSSVTVTAGVSGTFTLQDDITKSDCNSSCTMIVTVNANPTCAIDGPDVVCYGTTNSHINTVTPVGGTVTHSWTITGNGTISGSTTNASVNVIAGSTGSYTITDAITRNGCPGSCSKTVNINPQPTCNIAGPDSLCASTSGTFTGTVLPAGYTSATFAWTISGSGTIMGPANGPTVSVDAGASGTFTLYLNVTRNGCVGLQSCSKTVKVNQTPSCNITGNTTVCYSTQSYSYTSSVTPSTGIITHSWTVTGAATISGSATGATVNVITSSNTVSTFTLCDNITRNGCASQCCITVNVNPNPTCSISGPTTVCQQSTNTYSNVILPPNGVVTHNWVVSGNGSISGLNTGATVTVIAGTGTNTYTITDNITRDGCPGSCSLPVTVNPLPTCNISGDDDVCGTEDHTYTSSVSPSGGVVTHNWSIIGSGTISGGVNDNQVTVIANNVDGSFTLTDNTTRNGCPGVCTYTVTTYQQPTCTIAGVDSTCAGSTNTFTATTLPAGGSVTHHWNITGNGTIIGGHTGATLTVQAGASGSYTITHEVWRNDCYDLCQKTIEVDPIPVITCGVLQYATGSATAATGPWTQMNGTCFDYNLCMDPAIPYYYFGVLSVATSQPIMKNFMNPFWVRNISDPATFFAYWATRGITASSPAPYNYLWQIFNGQHPWFFIRKNPNGTYKAVDGFAYYLVTHGYSALNTNADTILRAMGDFPTEALTFRGTYTSISGCASDSVSLIMRFNQIPTCGITGPDYVCPQETGITYTAPANLNYQWTITGNGSIVGSSVQRNVTITALGEGTYTITLLLTNPVTLCQSTCSKLVTVQYRTITGVMTYPNCYGTSMNNIVLGLVPVPGITPIQTATTAANGSFAFTNLCAGDYTIKVIQNTKPIGGINSTDAAQVLIWPTSGLPIQHARFSAGDVMISGDDLNFMGGADALLIQQHFVFGTPFAGPSWSYWLKNQMVNSNLPAPPLTWKVTLPANSNLSNIDLIGIVTGDFDQSYIPGTAKNTSDNLDLLYEETRNIKENTEFDLPLNAVYEMNLTAVSLIVNIPSDLIEVKDVLVNGSNSGVSYNVTSDVLTISWYSDQPVHVAENTPVVVLKLKTTAAFVEGSNFRITLAGNPLNELADADANVIPHAILGVAYITNSALGVNDISKDNFAISCHPNPFRDYSTISYVLPDNGEVSLEVVNLVGQVVSTVVKESQTAGKHSVKVSSATMPSGVYMIVMKYRNHSEEIIKTLRVVVNK